MRALRHLNYRWPLTWLGDIAGMIGLVVFIAGCFVWLSHLAEWLR